MSDGSYSVGGVDVGTLRLRDVRALVAVVDDEPWVFTSSLRENLRLAAPVGGLDDHGEGGSAAEASAVTDDDLVRSLARAGLADWYASLPDGLDTRLGTGGRGVSGGERARLAVARAHLSERPVILMDEPVAHLDRATARDVLDEALAGDPRITVVVVSHQPVEARRFDTLLELSTSCPPP